MICIRMSLVCIAWQPQKHSSRWCTTARQTVGRIVERTKGGEYKKQSTTSKVVRCGIASHRIITLQKRAEKGRSVKYKLVFVLLKFTLPAATNGKLINRSCSFCYSGRVKSARLFASSYRRYLYTIVSSIRRNDLMVRRKRNLVELNSWKIVDNYWRRREYNAEPSHDIDFVVTIVTTVFS